MTCEMRLTRVLGLPAILGERLLARVERTALDPRLRHLRGLVIRRGLGGARWVSREGVSVLGDVSVVLQSAPVRPPKDADCPLGRVTDESGLTLGRVTDAWLRPDTLEITALEVTLGPLEDLRRGRLRVRDWAIQTASGGETQVLIERQRWEV